MSYYETGDAGFNLLLTTDINSMAANDPEVAAALNYYKYYRITRISIVAKTQYLIARNELGATAMNNIQGNYATRLMLEREPDPPDNLTEMINSSYSKMHPMGQGFKRAWTPRAIDVLAGDATQGFNSRLGVGRKGQWILCDPQGSYSDHVIPYYGLQWFYPSSSQQPIYQVFTICTCQFKTRRFS